MTTLTTFESTFPPDDQGSTPGERLAVARFLEEVRGEFEANQIDAAWTAREAELAAHDATVTLVGAEAAEVAVWDGQPDGTAVGVLDGLAVVWTRTEGVRIVHRCPSCTTTTTTPLDVPAAPAHVCPRRWAA
jgi:hypothetical protein